VIALGSGVTGFACGDLVAGVDNQRERSGSYAEYLTVPTSEIVRKPATFTMAEVAAYPTVAIAAWRYLIQAADVQRGERVLVHGGAGGTGSVIVQIAKARGAYVIATASARNHDYLRESAPTKSSTIARRASKTSSAMSTLSSIPSVATRWRAPNRSCATAGAW
jgi:NADPH:quinone reductase-like Zn-dependent oxidoreductase